MSRKNLKCIFAYVQPADHARFKAMPSMSEFIRACIDEYLDAVEEPLLLPIGEGGRPGRRKSKASE